MNALNKYVNIIQNAKKENRSKSPSNPGFYEEHHILPKSIYPLLKNKKWNIVLLTVEEHLQVHICLSEMFNPHTLNYNKMIGALHTMLHGQQGKQCSMSLEERERYNKLFSETKSEIMKEKWSDVKYRKMVSDKTKEACNTPEHKELQHKLVSERWKNDDGTLRKKMSDSVKQTWTDEELLRKQSERMIKLHQTKEHKEKLKAVYVSKKFKEKMELRKQYFPFNIKITNERFPEEILYFEHYKDLGRFFENLTGKKNSIGSFDKKTRKLPGNPDSAKYIGKRWFCGYWIEFTLKTTGEVYEGKVDLTDEQYKQVLGGKYQ